MKLTYLAYTEQPDGSVNLDQVSRDQWRQIVQKNPALPPEKRRYFITDCFQDIGLLDCMVIETTWDEYRKWNRERMAAKRNRECGKKVQIFPLDANIRDQQSDLSFYDVMLTEGDEEEKILNRLRIEELRRALADWRIWGPYLLELYLMGEKRDCVPALVWKYKVSPQTARKYKRQFENFLKKFLKGVSF